MEEFNERVSDIATSPVIHRIWQLNYRQSLSFCLALCMVISLSLPLLAQEARISRYEFLDSVYERIYNRRLSEIEAVNLGLIDMFDDGSFHLDWPVSRGMAAVAFYRLAVQGGSAAKLPRAFADISASSTFRKALETVGGAFLPLKKGRFDPNYLINRQDVFHALRILIEKNVLKQEDRSDMTSLPVADPVETVPEVSSAVNESIYSISPDTGFRDSPAVESSYRASAYQRIARARGRLSDGQVNPQAMTSIEDAANAMADVDAILERLGGSVMEMTSTYPSNPDDEQVLRSGLAQIENVLSAVKSRFEYSKMQLKTVMPIDPDQVRRCEELNSKLDSHLEKVEVLSRRIAGRLAEPQKKEEANK